MAKRKNNGSDEFINFFAYGVAAIITIFMWMVRILVFIPFLIIKFIEWIYNKKKKKKNRKQNKAANIKEKVSTNKSLNKKSSVEEDVVYDSLEDWQKKEVDEGNYDSYNFEEEELEEDDYYNEDDE